MFKPLPEIFHYLDETVFFISMVGILLVITESTFRYGLRRAKKTSGDFSGQVSALGGTLLGLVALMLGFAFAMSLGRFNTRQDLLRQEINDIQTAYLYSDTLPKEDALKMKRYFHEYTGLRVAYYKSGTLAAQMQDNIALTNTLQKKIWAEVVQLQAHEKNSGKIGDFMNTLTRVFSDENNRTAARSNHIPEAIIWLLIFVASCATGTVAYGIGLKGTRIFWPNVVLILAICAVLSIILDLDRPIRGIIQIDQGGMAALHETIAKDIAVPTP